MTQVHIFAEDRLIGRGNLVPEDPSMGVASAVFEPTRDYAPRKHALFIDGVRNDSQEIVLTAESVEFGRIACAGVFIDDYTGTLGELRATLLGIDDYDRIVGV